MFNIEKTRGGITKYSGATESIAFRFTTSRVEKTSSNARFKLITENSVTRFEHAGFERAEVVRVLGGGCGSIRSTNLFSILTGGTGGLI
jgi:hypothetical protein